MSDTVRLRYILKWSTVNRPVFGHREQHPQLKTKHQDLEFADILSVRDYCVSALLTT